MEEMCCIHVQSFSIYHVHY